MHLQYSIPVYRDCFLWLCFVQRISTGLSSAAADMCVVLSSIYGCAVSAALIGLGLLSLLSPRSSTHCFFFCHHIPAKISDMSDIHVPVSGRTKDGFKVVALTERTSPPNICMGHNAVVLGHCIAEHTIAISPLLAGIRHTEGRADLPHNISPEDVKQWETAHWMRAWGMQSPIGLPQLVTVLKVRVRP